MDLAFHPISLERQPEYSALFSLCPVKSSDYSFLNLWAWAEEYGLEWAWKDDLVWIRQTRPETFYWAPVGAWDQVNFQRCLGEHFKAGTVFIRILQPLLEIWKTAMVPGVEWEASRDHWDYLYAAKELIELRGNRFHKKKNLVNQFRKLYNYQYLAFDSTLIGRAMDMQEDWCTWRDCESSEALAAENRVISRVLNKWTALPGIMGGAILVDGQMVAYTIGEQLSDDTLVIHFEKGDTQFKGGNQAINQMFLEHSGIDASFVNREQDLGNEGLRKAKLSYHPVGFVEKCRVLLTASH
ncbi:MAG: DUF2156 domain-containing protein [Desulfobacterium sp.]|nr:DUF2156 domain-containing protein [Desulfobacterium sp.]